jgi:hypothetical protein
METANMLSGIQKNVMTVRKDSGLMPSQSPVMGMLSNPLPQINPGDELARTGPGRRAGDRMYGK